MHSDRSPATPLSEREWDKLINMVLDGRVVPVLGPELLTVPDAFGQPESLYDRWGKILAEQYGLQLPEQCAIPLLYYVTNRRSGELSPNDIAYDIDDVVRRQHAPIPEALRQLAEITAFPVYLTTTIDHQLKRALDVARADQSGPARQIVFTPRGAKAQIDLPHDASSGPPCAFHLFGATSPVDEAFAKTEDDLIEFSWSLLDSQYAPQDLYEYLLKKTILLIGCHFPDWLGRFLIYALHGRRPDAINVYYVGSQLEPGLEDFLKRRRAKILQVPRTTDFVAELHQRWQKSKPTVARAPAVAAPVDPSAMKRGAVFISYAREDFAAVARIRAELEAHNIDAWMDETGLEPGVEFEQTIREHIRSAAFFMPIISRSLDANRAGRFLWKEWRWAEDVNLERRREDNYLQPLCVDEVDAGSRFVEAPMRSMHWTRLKNGHLPDDFVRYLASGIRAFRRGR